MSNKKAASKRAWATAVMVSSLAVQALIAWGFMLWCDRVPLRYFVVVAGSALIVSATVHALLRRWLTLPFWQMGFVLLATLLFLWKYPTTATMRFFTSVGRVRPSMTVGEARACLPECIFGLNIMPGVGVSKEDAAKTRNGIPANFTGSLVCNAQLNDSYAGVFEVKNGVILSVSRFVDGSPVD